MTDHSHLSSLLTRLHNERTRLDAAATPGEVIMRTMWVRQLENEVAREEARVQAEIDALSDALSVFDADDLYRELTE